jgi:tRNA dimethylallyltransferase
MIVEGFEKEVLNLKPYLEVLRRKKVVGYTDMIEYLFDKKITRQQAIEKVKQHQRNYAKRQMTWFRNVPGVIWLNPLEEDFLDKVYQICDEYLKNA